MGGVFGLDDDSAVAAAQGRFSFIEAQTAALFARIVARQAGAGENRVNIAGEVYRFCRSGLRRARGRDTKESR